MKRRPFALLAALFMSAGAAFTSEAAPPTDAQIETAITTFSEKEKAAAEKSAAEKGGSVRATDRIRFAVVSLEGMDLTAFTPAQIKTACGNHMYGHWFGKSQWVFISRENYEKLQHLAEGRAFDRSYDDLRREYAQLKAVFDGEIRDPRAEQFRASRPYFDNSHSVMRDVWEFPRVVGEEREGHATPKPVDMAERCMRSSLRDGELALEPFGGSFSTLIGAHRAGRRCYAMEIDPLWVDVGVRRWQKYSGLTATLEGDGRTFQQVEHERTQAKAVVSSGS
jgi:hypothetical protein